MNPHEWGRKGGQASYGERKGSSKLNTQQVRDILSSPETSVSLAKRYGVGETTVQYIRLRKTWRHVQPSTEVGRRAQEACAASV
jgi:hypothetical protein